MLLGDIWGKGEAPPYYYYHCSKLDDEKQEQHVNINHLQVLERKFLVVAVVYTFYDIITIIIFFLDGEEEKRKEKNLKKHFFIIIGFLEIWFADDAVAAFALSYFHTHTITILFDWTTARM